MDLQSFVDSNKIDVVLVQETKLMEGKTTPKLNGFSAIRADRPSSTHPGGGLLTYVKHDIAYHKIGAAKNGEVEALMASVQQKANKWLDLINIYIPPRAGGNNIDWIPVKDSAIVTGDLNGHSQIWDREQTPDQMGELIVDFMIGNNLFCCNEGSATRVNRGTGGMSAPDVTLATPNLSNKISWSTLDELGSDHRHIVIEVNHEFTNRQPQKKRRARWKRAKTDWKQYADSVEAALEMNENPDRSHLVRRYPPDLPQ